MLRRRALLWSLLPLLVAGCGGSSHHSSPTGSTSTDTVGPQITIAWPARARDFAAPSFATAALVTFPGVGANGTDLTEVVSRPVGAAAITKTYSLGLAVHPGTHLLRVDYLADASSTGAPLATATMNVKVTDRGAIKTLDGKDLGTVSYDSQVTGLTIAVGQSVEVGAKSDLVITAQTLGGVAALVPGSVKLTLSSGSANLGLNADGSVTGLSVGSASVFATLEGRDSPAAFVAIVAPSLKARTTSVVTNDMVVDATRGSLWVALSGGVAQLDPATATVGAPVSLGAAPDLLALSDDGTALYADLPMLGAVRRINPATGAVVSSFGLASPGFGSAARAIDLDVQPGSPSTLAIVSQDIDDTGYDGPSIFDDGVRRPNTLGTYASSRALWISPDRIVAYPANFGEGLIDVAVDSQGASATRNVPTQADLSHRLVLAGGRLYGANGVVLNASTYAALGAFAQPTYQGGYATYLGPAVDAARKRVYFVEVGAGGAYVRLHVYDADTFASIANRSVGNVTVTPTLLLPDNPRVSLVGVDTLAFRLYDQVIFLDGVSKA